MINNKKQTGRKIYRKTLLKVFAFVAKNGRTECKKVARALRTEKNSALKALRILHKAELIKARKYSDMGVTYYYPSDKREFTILVFRPTKSFAIVCNSALGIERMVSCSYCSFMLPDENLHYFLKIAHKFLSIKYKQLPGKHPFIAIPGTRDPKKGTVSSDIFPELRLIDIERFVCERLKTSSCHVLCYDFSLTKNEKDRDFIAELVTKAISENFKKKNKKTDSEQK